MPTLDDDGHRVTLDLHGATVDEALDLTFQTVRLAEERGRTSVKLIHGSSTTTPHSPRRTIKQALHEELDRGALSPHATDTLRAQNHLVLSLDVTATRDPTPIRLADVTR
jgi:DNA-nicking Smr family endonuclease